MGTEPVTAGVSWQNITENGAHCKKRRHSTLVYGWKTKRFFQQLSIVHGENENLKTSVWLDRVKKQEPSAVDCYTEYTDLAKKPTLFYQKDGEEQDAHYSPNVVNKYLFDLF